MKDRLPALDGLRGFAALSVLLSHTGYNPILLTSAPFILTAYKIISVGPNSVQILFVLSGFLMAFLYPQIPKARKYIQKRYARIIPIYATVVFFLWIIDLEEYVKVWYLQLGTLLILAGFIYLIWNFIKRIPNIGKNIFYAFAGLQILTLLIVTIILPHYTYADTVLLPANVKNFITFLSNITLTTPFARDIPNMSGVFWSLAPEIYFYLLYPFIVIPLIQLCKKWGWLITILIIFGVTKILFDLDKEIVSVAALHTMNIARASGFVAGVTIGTIYQTKGTTWNKLLPLIKNPFSSLAALFLLFAMQWGDSAIRDGQSVTFMNFYYLTTSWIIAFIIVNAIFPSSLIYKIFSKKIVVFLGIISYSTYLIHPEVIGWASSFTQLLQPFLASQGIRDVIYVCLAVLLTIGIAASLFRLVEFLYFSSKKTVLVTTLAKESEEVTVSKRYALIRHPLLKVSLIILTFFVLYTCSYSPTQLAARNAISKSLMPVNEKSLLQNDVSIPFTAKYNNLSETSVYLRYAKNAAVTIGTRRDPAKLVFQLFDTSGKQLFTSSRHAYVTDGSPRFGFGFPTIPNSKGKTYVVKLSLVNGTQNDQVYVDETPMSFVSVYTTSKQMLFHTPWIFIINRLVLAFTDPGFVFAFVFVLFIVFFTRLAVPKKSEAVGRATYFKYLPQRLRWVMASK